MFETSIEGDKNLDHEIFLVKISRKIFKNLFWYIKLDVAIIYWSKNVEKMEKKKNSNKKNK